MSAIKNDTICALATARMNCAIHLIRLSGVDAYEIINKITNKEVNKASFKIVRRFIVDKNKNKVDDVLLNCFENPKSYTGEDLIEINCHGGVYLADKIINLLIKNGARMAEPGEFSHRALLNNKIDVTQVEAINNLVFAKNDFALKGAIDALSGNVSQALKLFRSELFNVLGQIIVNIDYPEFDDVPQISDNQVLSILKTLNNQILDLIKESKKFIPLSEGIKIALVGEPNVGKSSLMNCLINDDKAIVSDIPGTTRDIVESIINIDGLTLKFFDTAGLRQSDDLVENIGINKAKDLLNKVDLILWLSDSRNIDKDDNEIKDIIKDKNYIKVFTKKDLLEKEITLKDNEVLVSSKNKDFNSLIEKIKSKFYTNDFNLNSEIQVLQSQRQINILEYVQSLVEKSIYDLESNFATLDLIAANIEIADREINKLLGKTNDYDFLDDLFLNFCLGK